MPLNPLDFSRFMYKPDHSGIADAIQNYYKGYEASQTPQRMALEQALKQSEIEKNQMYSPFTGTAGNIYTLNKLKQNPNINPEDYASIEEDLKLQQQNVQSNIDRRAQISQFQKFMSLPAKDRESLVAKWRTIYDDEHRIVEAIVNNESFADAAVRAGFAPEQVDSLERTYATTDATKTAIQTAIGAKAEAQSLESFITKGMKNYSRKFAGYSPKQIIDSFKNDPKTNEELSNFLAARALTLENTAARIRQAGLSDAEKIVSQLNSKSLNNVKAFEGLVSPEVYELTQQKITDELNKAADSRIRALTTAKPKPKKLTPYEEKVKEVSGGIINGLNSSKMITIKDPITGQKKRISEEEFIAGGGKR